MAPIRRDGGSYLVPGTTFFVGNAFKVHSSQCILFSIWVLTYAEPLALDDDPAEEGHGQHGHEHYDGAAEHLEAARVRQRQPDVHDGCANLQGCYVN